MENLETKLLEYLQGAEVLFLSKAPAAYQAAVQLVSLDAWLGLIIGAVCLTISMSIILFVYPKCKRFLDNREDDAAIGTGLLAAIPALTFFFAAMAEFFSRSNWIGVINPELGLLYEIYTKALS